MHGRRTATLLAFTLALTAVLLTGPAPASPAASRQPLADALSGAYRPASAFGSGAGFRDLARRAMPRRAAERHGSARDEFRISSERYGAAEVESVAAVLRSLDHGPELAELSVFVATPEQLGEVCGAGVLACYFPSVDEMLVSGVDQPVDGVPRDFAIAHEYGHHVASTQAGRAVSGIEGGTLRWATYERVCQLTRSGRLFPGEQGTHYWRNPEEAFAQAYAFLNRPDDRVVWDYTSLLRPTVASLAKIHADVSRPWAGPVESRWEGTLAAPAPPKPAATAGARSGAIGVDAGAVVGDPPWLATRVLRTPLDGLVAVSVRTPAVARVSVTLRDRELGRPLARSVTGPDGRAAVSYSNCGADALRVEVRAIDGPTPFEAELTRP